MQDQILVEMKPLQNQNPKKATVDITFDTTHGELTIKKLNVIHQDGKDPWVAFPQINYPDKNTGEFRNLRIVFPGSRLKKAITDAVLNEYSILCHTDEK